EIIPRYEKWRPALIPLSLVSINVAFAAATTQFTNLFNAIGKIKTTFKLMIMWTVLTWAFIPFLASKFDVVGAAAGYALVGSSSVVAIYIAHRYVKFSLLDGIYKPGFAAIAMAVAMIIVRNIIPETLSSIFVLGLVGFITYALASYLIVGPAIASDVKKMAKNFIKK
ncbi:MAG: polysaccharide biosynthesis C-terminal domain-containing protein, partial [Patescibacteria group bacterium]